MKKAHLNRLLYFILIFTVFSTGQLGAQALNEDPALDRKVNQFLAANEDRWNDMNVPTIDAELLFDLVIKGRYTSALEIGTSTGYSGIYIAWALSKTGGKLITIEINEELLQ